MQKVIIYSQSGCFNRAGSQDARSRDQFYDTLYYQNEHKYSILPNESVLFLLQSCGDNWLRHGLTYEIKFVNNRFTITPNKRPYQLCLYVTNFSEESTLQVEPNTPLSMILEQSEIMFKLTHLSHDELHKAYTFAALDPVYVESCGVSGKRNQRTNLSSSSSDEDNDDVCSVVPTVRNIAGGNDNDDETKLRNTSLPVKRKFPVFLKKKSTRTVTDPTLVKHSQQKHYSGGGGGGGEMTENARVAAAAASSSDDSELEDGELRDSDGNVSAAQVNAASHKMLYQNRNTCILKRNKIDPNNVDVQHTEYIRIY